jgi:endonuclease/exonuclease/phosphatase family metal-dependent hydrolase
MVAWKDKWREGNPGACPSLEEQVQVDQSCFLMPRLHGFRVFNEMRSSCRLLFDLRWVTCWWMLVWQGACGNEVIRIMAANTTAGNHSSYDTSEGNRIFRGLKPDIALVQELNVGVGENKNTPATYRGWVDANFGTTFCYHVESGKSIPNGIVSRFPIRAAGVWEDREVPNREFAWARIDLPGENDLWAISLHLKASGDSAKVREREAEDLLKFIQRDIPATDYIVLGGDLNTSHRTEPCIRVLGGRFATGEPWPVDQAGDGDTNAGRTKPYDWVLPDKVLHECRTPLVIGSMSFPDGLVFDSRVFKPLGEVPPILVTDSGAPQMQHMAVMRAFLIPKGPRKPEGVKIAN